MNFPATDLELEGRRFGPNQCCVIGEVAQAHDGSLGTAHAYIDAIADAGADAVKFQTHIAAAESTPSEPWRVKFSRQDASRYEYWRRMEFTSEQWAGLKEHADQRKLLFLSSPFSVEAVTLLDRIGVAAWKIASGEVGNPLLFDAMVRTRRPFLVSTGMSPWSEIQNAAERLREARLPFAVMQCTSMYPTPPEKVGLGVFTELRERCHCPVGLSDHSGKIYAGLAAATLGASVVEVHVTFHRGMFGPDVPASLTVEELKQLCEGVRFINRMMAAPVDKDAAAGELAGMRRLFTKSVVIARDLPAGTALKSEHVTLKKPGTGIPGERLPALLGRKLRCAKAANEFLAEEDLEQPAAGGEL